MVTFSCFAIASIAAWLSLCSCVSVSAIVTSAWLSPALLRNSFASSCSWLFIWLALFSNDATFGDCAKASIGAETLIKKDNVQAILRRVFIISSLKWLTVFGGGVIWVGPFSREWDRR